MIVYEQKKTYCSGYDKKWERGDTLGSCDLISTWTLRIMCAWLSHSQKKSFINSILKVNIHRSFKLLFARTLFKNLKPTQKRCLDLYYWNPLTEDFDDYFTIFFWFLPIYFQPFYFDVGTMLSIAIKSKTLFIFVYLMTFYDMVFDVKWPLIIFHFQL